MKAIVTLLVLAIAASLTQRGLANGSDDFNDNSKDATKWGADIISGSGAVTETNTHLHYSSAPSANERSIRPWILTRGSLTQPWEMQVEIVLPLFSLAIGQEISLKLRAENSADSNDFFPISFVTINESGTTLRGFTTNPRTDFVSQGETSALTSSTSVALRITWTPGTLLLTSYYDADGAVGGFTWTEQATFNPSGWAMAPSDTFMALLHADSENIAVAVSDNVYYDSFSETGMLIPEPSTAGMLLLGAASLHRLIPRRRKSRLTAAEL